MAKRWKKGRSFCIRFKVGKTGRRLKHGKCVRRKKYSGRRKRR